MPRVFSPCEECPLRNMKASIPLLLVGKAMGEVYTAEDYDRMYGSLTNADREFAEGLESGIQSRNIDGENCEGPKRTLFAGKLGCKGYVN